MKKYKGILREREPWLKAAIVLAAGYMMYLSLTGGMITYAALSVVVILAVFFQKEHIISDEGADISYNLFGLRHTNRWEWEDISALKTDYKKAYPDVILHINKDVSIRDFKMKRSDIPAILELAERINPEIYIDDISEEEQERRGQERLHQQEVERARKAAQKRKK